MDAGVGEFAKLYFIGSDSSVWTYSPTGDWSWQFSRLSACQRARNTFVLKYGKRGVDECWVLLDQSPGAKGAVIGHPLPAEFGADNRRHPPFGRWRIWNEIFSLVDRPPEEPGSVDNLPLRFEAPFGVITYTEQGRVARIELIMRSGAVTDEGLEQVLGKIAWVLRNLAKRPSMALFIRSDVREASVPAVRHIRRFLAFMQEMGPEFVLTGRGSAIVVRASGFLGSTLLSLIRMVQRMLPPPWPESLVTSMEDAEAFLAELIEEHLNSLPAFSSPTPTCGSSAAAVPPAAAATPTAAAAAPAGAAAAPLPVEEAAALVVGQGVVTTVEPTTEPRTASPAGDAPLGSSCFACTSSPPLAVHPTSPAPAPLSPRPPCSPPPSGAAPPPASAMPMVKGSPAWNCDDWRRYRDEDVVDTGQVGNPASSSFWNLGRGCGCSCTSEVSAPSLAIPDFPAGPQLEDEVRDELDESHRCEGFRV